MVITRIHVEGANQVDVNDAAEGLQHLAGCRIHVGDQHSGALPGQQAIRRRA